MAATTAQGGFGLDLKIDISSTLTTIVQVLSADFPEFSKFIAEATGHDSDGGYYEAVASGKRRLNPFSVEIGWDTAEATHAAVVTAFNSDDAVDMSIEDPDGDEVIAFAAHIERISRVSQQEGTYRANVTIHPTGQPTIT